MQLAAETTGAFGQPRTARRAISLLLANVLCVGRRWISRLILVRGPLKEHWGNDYKFFSRSVWQPAQLFAPVIVKSLQFFSGNTVVVGGDETRLRRGGRRVQRSRWTRDPMSPPFHVNYVKAIRCVQLSLLLPLHERFGVDARAVPVSFEPVDLPRRPAKKAPAQDWASYREACKQANMCLKTIEQLRSLRALLDEQGAWDRTMLGVFDGGFSNRTMFTAPLDRVELLARCRKDAVLCHPANDPSSPGSIYGRTKFTPEQIRLSSDHPWQEAPIFFGGQWRTVRYKQLTPVLWQGGARRRPLRLIVVAPTAYRPSPCSRTYYRSPSYLLSTDLTAPVLFLLQSYFDRWQIEVNHRDEKQLIGVADPQVWNDRSVDRQPAFMALSYSLLLLAALLAYGPRRTDDYLQPPRWQKRRSRPSCEDLLALLRTQAIERTRQDPASMPFPYDPITAVSRAAA